MVQKTNRKTFCRIFLIFVFVVPVLIGSCTSDEYRSHGHYYLKGYDQLEFRDTAGNPVPVRQYIGSSVRTNGFRSYEIRDTTLTLVHERSGEPYTGFIRTFHKSTYNLQGEYRDGKIFRLRYWHPNRVLGMDTDFRKKNTSLWDASGNLVAAITPEETYYYYQGTQKIKEIRRDTMHSHYNRKGELTRYTIFSDSTLTFYYGDGTRRMELPYNDGRTSDGIARRWHRNGQLQAIGNYKDGKQHGTWIEYDSLGNEVRREFHDTVED